MGDLVVHWWPRQYVAPGYRACMYVGAPAALRIYVSGLDDPEWPDHYWSYD